MGRQLIIVGFHRSGTSLLGQLLHGAGLFLGDELMGAKPSNPYGHFEDWEVVHFHDRILSDHGDTWQVAGPRSYHVSRRHWDWARDFVTRREVEHELWGFKDPRVCLFLPIWRHLLPDARFVVVFRDPAESVHSLERRHSSQLFAGEGSPEPHMTLWRIPDHGLRMWDAYNRSVLSFVEANPDDCIVLPFRSLQEGFPVIGALNRRWDLGLEEIPSSAVFDPHVTRGRDTNQLVHSGETAYRIERTWERLEALVEPVGV